MWARAEKKITKCEESRVLGKPSVGSEATKNDSVCWGREQVIRELKSSLNEEDSLREQQKG